MDGNIEITEKAADPELELPKDQRNHLEKWSDQNREAVDELVDSFRKGAKAIFIEGEIHSGKTSLALALAQQLRKLPTHERMDAVFTTPAIEETVGASSSSDRTGAKYVKLPRLNEIDQKTQPTIIVIDEISSRGPAFTNLWKSYIDSDKTRFLLLTHPNKPSTQEWLKLFNKDQIVRFTFSGQNPK